MEELNENTVVVATGTKMQAVKFNKKGDIWNPINKKTLVVTKGGKYEVVDTEDKYRSGPKVIIKVGSPGKHYMIHKGDLKESINEDFYRFKSVDVKNDLYVANVELGEVLKNADHGNDADIKRLATVIKRLQKVLKGAKKFKNGEDVPALYESDELGEDLDLVDPINDSWSDTDEELDEGWKAATISALIILGSIFGSHRALTRVERGLENDKKVEVSIQGGLRNGFKRTLWTITVNPKQSEEVKVDKEKGIISIKNSDITSIALKRKATKAARDAGVEANRSVRGVSITVGESVEALDEALDMVARIKRRAAMRKAAPAIARGRKRAARRKPTRDVMIKRATNQARNIIFKKLAGGKSKEELGFSERSRIEKQLAKKKGAILKIAKKLLPALVAKEKEKSNSNDDK